MQINRKNTQSVGGPLIEGLVFLIPYFFYFSSSLDRIGNIQIIESGECHITSNEIKYRNLIRFGYVYKL